MRRERLTQHNTQLTYLFQPSRRIETALIRTADLGSTAQECWCTSKPAGKLDWKPDVAKIRPDAKPDAMKRPDTPDISLSHSPSQE
jgi:hypothetical protein